MVYQNKYSTLFESKHLRTLYSEECFTSSRLFQINSQKIKTMTSLFLLSSIIFIISSGLTTNGFIGKSLMFPVTKNVSSVWRESIVTS